MSSPSRSFALDVAAPSLRADPDAPWVGAFGGDGDKGLAATFWLAFHGLSIFAHAVAIAASVAGPVFLALVPIPLLAGMCIDVKPVVKPLERVEMAIIEVAPAPIVEPAPVIAPEPDVVAAAPRPKKRRAPDAVLREDVVSMGIIGLLGSSNDSTLFAELTASADDNVLGGVEGGIVGGLIGAEVGEAFGVGGLGLRGGGGAGMGGLGTIGGGAAVGIGSLGPPKSPRVALDGASTAQLERLARALAFCRVRDSVEGTALVKAGRVVRATATPKNACVERSLRTSVGALAVDDGVVPFAVTPR